MDNCFRNKIIKSIIECDLILEELNNYKHQDLDFSILLVSLILLFGFLLIEFFKSKDKRNTLINQN
jgi:hypothetical protein